MQARERSAPPSRCWPASRRSADRCRRSRAAAADRGCRPPRSAAGAARGSWARRSNRIVVPGAGLADDEDRPADRLVGDLGMLLAPLDDLKPVLSGRTTSTAAISTPRSLRRASLTSPSHSRSNPSRQAVVIAEVVAARRSRTPARRARSGSNRSVHSRRRPAAADRVPHLRWLGVVEPAQHDEAAVPARRCPASARDRSPWRRWRSARRRRHPGATPLLVTELCRRRGSRHSCQMFSSVTFQ